MTHEDDPAVRQEPQFQVRRFQSGQVLVGNGSVKISRLDTGELGQVIYNLQSTESRSWNGGNIIYAFPKEEAQPFSQHFIGIKLPLRYLFLGGDVIVQECFTSQGPLSETSLDLDQSENSAEGQNFLGFNIFASRMLQGELSVKHHTYPRTQVILATDICEGLIMDRVPSLLNSASSYCNNNNNNKNGQYGQKVQ